jgi:FkbM family methyltransferase
VRIPNPCKPWFVYRPGQLVRRAVRAIRPPVNPVQVVNLPWGCPIEIDTRESVGRSIWTAGVYDLAVVEVLYRLADPTLLAIDAGANIGAMTGLLATRAAEVWAFEPHPDVFSRLERNVARLRGMARFAPCRVFQTALTARDGEVCLQIPDDFSGNQGTARVNVDGGVPVRAARLDSELSGLEVGVMKLDVEGHELSVIRGSEESLKAGRVRQIIFEEHDGPDSPVCQQLREFGFTLFEIGWKLSGPVVAKTGSGVHTQYEAPSYLATLNPNGALARCATRGWECFQHGMRVRRA